MNSLISESAVVVRQSWRDSSATVAAEAVRAVGAVDPEEAQQMGSAVVGAERVFVFGQGRSGMALRGLAIRLMHLGLRVHVVGAETTPAIVPGDLLLVASGTGTTASVVSAARAAIAAGASVAAFTAAPHSTLASLASTVMVVPAAGKDDRSGRVSHQYAGSLFEQAVWLAGDVLFDAL
nr:6-phospho-3-hexuloisomerase [Streptomyces sp. WAC04770]